MLRIFGFIKRVAVATVRFVGRTIRTVARNCFGIIGLGLMTLGAASILAAAPMELVVLPIWIEATLVVPVLATLTTMTLVWLIGWQGGLSCSENTTEG
jgi:hypothetical protein